MNSNERNCKGQIFSKIIRSVCVLTITFLHFYIFSQDDDDYPLGLKHVVTFIQSKYCLYDKEWLCLRYKLNMLTSVSLSRIQCILWIQCISTQFYPDLKNKQQ